MSSSPNICKNDSAFSPVSTSSALSATTTTPIFVTDFKQEVNDLRNLILANITNCGSYNPDIEKFLALILENNRKTNQPRQQFHTDCPPSIAPLHTLPPFDLLSSYSCFTNPLTANLNSSSPSIANFSNVETSNLDSGNDNNTMNGDRWSIQSNTVGSVGRYESGSSQNDENPLLNSVNVDSNDVLSAQFATHQFLQMFSTHPQPINLIADSLINQQQKMNAIQGSNNELFKLMKGMSALPTTQTSPTSQSQTNTQHLSSILPTSNVAAALSNPTIFFPRGVPSSLSSSSNGQNNTSRILPNNQSHMNTSARSSASTNSSNMSISLAPAVVEKKKQPNDDYVKIIRQNDLSEERIAKIEIPVKEAIILDPDFRPSSEHQIIQMVIKNKNVEEMDVGDVMTQLCKKLAEKRVFGQSLMADLTVAGPNHSTYNNLPLEGIIYIQDVCRKVLYNRVGDDNEFWDVFRESMRKLAARCRRVRHSRKSKSKTDSNIPMKREATADMVLRHEVMSDSSTDSGHDINALNSSGETSQT